MPYTSVFSQQPTSNTQPIPQIKRSGYVPVSQQSVVSGATTPVPSATIQPYVSLVDVLKGIPSAALSVGKTLANTFLRGPIDAARSLGGYLTNPTIYKASARTSDIINQKIKELDKSDPNYQTNLKNIVENLQKINRATQKNQQIFSKTPLQTVGGIGEAAALFLPVGEVSALKGLKLGQAIKRGAAIGGLFGATQAAQEENPTVGSTALDIGTGAAFGALTEPIAVWFSKYGSKPLNEIIRGSTLDDKIVEDFKNQAAMQLEAKGIPSVADQVRSMDLVGVKNPKELVSTTLAKLGSQADDATVRTAITNWGNSMDVLVEYKLGEGATGPGSEYLSSQLSKSTQNPLKQFAKASKELPAVSQRLERLNKLISKGEQSLQALNKNLSNKTLDAEVGKYNSDVVGNLLNKIDERTNFINTLKQEKQSLERLIPELTAVKDTAIKFDLASWKDKPAFSLTRETMERNIERIAGKDAPIIKALTTDAIKENETQRVLYINSIRKAVNEKVVKGLGIKSGSKDSKLVQRFGEGNITLEDLKKSTKNWENVTKASDYFRKLYDQVLSDVNKARSAYGYDPIPQRKDYFRHFQAMDTVFSEFGSLFKNGDQLPTEISGLTGIFKPNKPFSNAELRRKGGKFTEDAVKGMDDYLNSISKQIFHTDSVQRARALETFIRGAEQRTGQDPKLQNFVSQLSEYGNTLAGKKSELDRSAEKMFGRRIFTVSRWLQGKTSKNLISANLSSALTNFIPFTESLATTSKPSVIRGIYDTVRHPLQNILGKNPEVLSKIDGVTSKFLVRRFPIEHIDLTKGQKVENVANYFFQTVDQFTARSIVAGKYYEAVSSGLPKNKAIQIADDYAGRLLADRSFGQLPNINNARTLGFITQFQTEINNMYSFVTKDMPSMAKSKTRLMGSLAQLAIYSYLFNEGFQFVTGRRPTVDPIDYFLTLTGVNQKGQDKNLGERLLSVGEDAIGNLPYVGGITGGRVPITSGLPNISGILSGKDNLGDEALKTLTTLAMPFGGGQLNKSIKGLSTFNRGYAATDAGNVKFPVDQNGLNFLRSLLFGQYATPEARQYYDTNQSPLGTAQSAQYKMMDNSRAVDFFYRTIAERERQRKLKELTDLFSK